MHTHPTDPDAHVTCAALRTLAYVLAGDVKLTKIRHVGKAIDRRRGIQITVVMSKWEPFRLDAPKPRRLGPTEKRILELAKSGPIAGRTLARRAGKPYSSYFRGLLTRLVAEGRLRREARGYSAGPQPGPG